MSNVNLFHKLLYSYDIERIKKQMKNWILITDALEYIEGHLTDEIKTEHIAKSLFCSKSTLEKLFKYFGNISIKDYVIRRRMSKAARELVENENCSILDIAVKYGYSSHEAFTRAFQGIWHTTPSEFRKKPCKFELFPGFKLNQELMEDENMINRKKVDISDLYDLMKERLGCFVICGDIKGLIPINDISVEAGDLAIITALSRMEAAAGEEDLVFRVGGDEFVILTDSKDSGYANKVVDEILSHNEETFTWNGHNIPLSLYATFMKLENKSIRYSELFTKIQNELNSIKENE